MSSLSQPKRRIRRPQWLLLFLLPVCGVFYLWLAQNTWEIPTSEIVSIAMHSTLRANYDADAPSDKIPGFRWGIIADTIHDDQPPQVDVEARMATLNAELQTPVASVTSIVTIVGSDTATATDTPMASMTPSVTETTATDTRSATITNTPTATVTVTNPPTDTSTPTATLTAIATNTLTLTPLATSTDTPTATATALTPLTSTPTATNTPTSTATPTVTATLTATPTDTPTATASATLTSTPTNTPMLTATVSSNLRDQINNLIAYVHSLSLAGGTENSLIIKLDAATQSLDNNDNGGTINNLQAFMNEVEAQRDKEITSPQADSLIAAAQAIVDQINAG